MKSALIGLENFLVTIPRNNKHDSDPTSDSLPQGRTVPEGPGWLYTSQG